MKALFFGVLSAILLSACGPAPGSASADNKAGREKATGTARQVQSVAAEEKNIDQVVVVTGTLAADQEIILGLKVAGRLSDLSVDLGSPVQKGQAIAKLDTTDFELRVRQAEAAVQQARVRLGLATEDSEQNINIEKTPVVRQARAEMDAARSRLERARSLLDRGLLPKADFDTTNSGSKVADAKYDDALEEGRDRIALLAQRRSELEIARQQLADAVLYAPITGMVRQRNANVGQYLAAGGPVVTVVQINPLRLRTPVPEREARNIRVEQPVRVTVDGAAGVHEGHVARLSPSFDETNRTLLVETEVFNTANLLRPGAFARAEIVVSSGVRALFVPASSIVNFAGVDRVFVIRDSKVSERRIKAGRRTEQGVEIAEGLSAGDQIVRSPGNMADGERVEVKE